MSEATHKKRKKMTALELSSPARCALKRIKKGHGISYTAAIERGVIALETKLNAQTI